MPSCLVCQSRLEPFIDFGRMPIANRLLLSPETTRPTDDNSMFGAMSATRTGDAAVRVGDVGRATTPLRPSGSAMFGEQLVDVVSEFGFVDANQRVRVTSVTKYRVGVEGVTEETA